MTKKIVFLIVLCSSLLSSCGHDTEISDTTDTLPPEYPLGENPDICEEASLLESVNWQAIQNEFCYKLSNFNLFEIVSHDLITPRAPGLLYELNSALFTDHARKYRYLYIPEGLKVEYSALNTFEFPLGSTLVKVFNLPTDTSVAGEEIIEIRLLVKRKNGWVTLVYKWIHELSDGYFTFSGDIVESVITHNGVAEAFNYRIPTFGQCATCHQNNSGGAEITPIGLKARHLNKLITYNETNINQLELWRSLNILSNLPDDLTSIDTAPDWKDETKNLQDRAKAYLDINCAHCHTEGGSGELSGLKMEYWRKDINYTHGRCNESQGWRGGYFDIWPGDGENSAIPRRIRHTEPKDKMPPIGRSLADMEAAQLISDWIDSLPYQECAE